MPITDPASPYYRRDRSYHVRRVVPVGALVEIEEPVVHYGLMVLAPGERVRVLSYVNAGFGGIRATVQDEVGLRHTDICAGNLSTDYEEG
jgi:hypothetical protein